MSHECGATAYLSPSLAVLAMDHLRQLGTHPPTDLGVETSLECFLEAHAEGDHYGLVTDTAKDTPDVWTTWSEDDPPAALTHLTACTRDNGHTDGLQDVCSLFAHHPGRCTFALAGPTAPGTAAGTAESVDELTAVLRELSHRYSTSGNTPE